MLIKFNYLLCKLDDSDDHSESSDEDKDDDNDDKDREPEALTSRDTKKCNCLIINN
jgi:hypothetical protein